MADIQQIAECVCTASKEEIECVTTYLKGLIWIGHHPGESPEAERIARRIQSVTDNAQPGARKELIRLTHELSTAIQG